MIFISSKISDGNMSSYCGDLNQAIRNKNKFFKNIGLNPENVVELRQVHGDKIIKVNTNSKNNTTKEADGLITNNPNIYLMIKAADCHQIGFYDPVHKATALIHAGYKGLEKGIIKKVVLAMQKNYGTDVRDLIVKFGPSIGPCHYRLDIWTDAENQLMNLGILKENIDNPKICTYENQDYFSHRRAKDTDTEDFRFATILGIKNEKENS